MAIVDITWVQKGLLKKCEDGYMIGRLRESYPVLPTNEHVRFFIDPLCDDPKPALDVKVFNDVSRDYIGLDYRQDSDFLPDFYDNNGYDMEARVEEIEEYLDGSLIIFSPAYVKSKDNKWFKNLYITKLLNDDKNKYFYFVCVPSVQMEPYKFEEILKNKEYFDLPDYDYELYETPELIICGNYAYKMKDEDKPLLVVSELNTTRWKVSDFDSVVKIDLSQFDEYKSYIVRASESLVFVEDALRNSIGISDEYVPLLDEIDSNNKLSESKVDNEEPTEEVEEEYIEEDLVVDETEAEFLKGLQMMTSEKKLQYRFDDIVNFHTSVKTNPLTILAGMSGTGKTQLAYNYAKMLNLSEDNNTLLFMPISPSYTEPSDVLGYLNSMNNSYVPAETGLVNFLVHASQNKNQMHMVIFDEMNLSQVEYWFSPFVSILEKDVDDRYLKLYDENATCNNSKLYPSKIKIDENIIFVGTVNIDETTKDFSDRLLDRTFVISLRKGKFEDFYDSFSSSKNKKEEYTRYKCKDASIFMSWNMKNNKNYLNAFDNHKNELLFLDEFDKLINKYIPNGGISYRVLRNIGNFILNVPRNQDGELVIERSNIFDTIINQTVMQKIRGTETQLESLIGIADSSDYSIDNSELTQLLNKYENVSEFEQVRSSIRKKAEDLKINGYTN